MCLIALTLLVGLQLYLLNVQRLVLEAQLDDLQPEFARAQVANEKMYSLQSDLINLSNQGDPIATKILQRYNLTVLGAGGPGAKKPTPEGQ